MLPLNRGVTGTGEVMQEWRELTQGPTADSLPSRPLVPALASLWSLGGQVWAGGCRRLPGVSPEGPFQSLPADLAGNLCVCFLSAQQGAAENKKTVVPGPGAGVSRTSPQKLWAPDVEALHEP